MDVAEARGRTGIRTSTSGLVVLCRTCTPSPKTSVSGWPRPSISPTAGTSQGTNDCIISGTGVMCDFPCTSECYFCELYIYLGSHIAFVAMLTLESACRVNKGLDQRHMFESVCPDLTNSYVKHMKQH